MFHYLYYSITTDEPKEKFRIVFYYFLAIKNIVAPSCSFNFPTKLICSGMLVFICLDKSIPKSL